jgi:hypothetical protein
LASRSREAEAGSSAFAQVETNRAARLAAKDANNDRALIREFGRIGGPQNGAAIFAPKKRARVKTAAASNAFDGPERPLYHKLIAILFFFTDNFVSFCNISEPFAGIALIARIKSAAEA